MKIRKLLNAISLLLSWVAIIVSTYFGLVNVIIILLFCLWMLFYLFNKKQNSAINTFSKNNMLLLFLIYYLIITLVNSVNGYTSSIILFLINYFILLIVAYLSVKINYLNIPETLRILKNFIVLTGLYGIYESTIRYNYIARIIRVDSLNWVNRMNDGGIAGVYQPSSIYLHYSYFGISLLVAWFISIFFPSHNKMWEIVSRVILIIALFVSQARICWIAFIVGMLIYALFDKHHIVSLRSMVISILSIIGFLVIIVLIQVRFNILGIINNRFLNIFEMQNGSFGQRMGTFLNWFSYAKDSPILAIFGTGYGSINRRFLQMYSFFSGYTTADSEITVYLVETGIIGFLLFVIGIITLLKGKSISKEGQLSTIIIILMIVESFTLDIAANPFILFLIYIFIFIKKVENDQVTANHIRD